MTTEAVETIFPPRNVQIVTSLGTIEYWSSAMWNAPVFRSSKNE
jgi:hypothetical protein